MKWALLGPAALLAPLAACNIVSAVTYFFHPPQIQAAEFKLTPGRLVLLVDLARPEEDSAVFRQALYDKLVEIFREHKVNTQLVPPQEVYLLQQQNPDFHTWSVQQIGRRLGAKQVLWIRIDRLQLREEPGSPLLAPVVDLRMKVIGASESAESARLWPTSKEADGRALRRARQARELTGPAVVDEEATKLGKDTAWLVAAPFYDVDLEQKTPWES